MHGVEPSRPSDSPSPRPFTREMLSMREGALRVSGRLEISGGVVCFEPEPWVNSVVAVPGATRLCHTGRHIRLVRARFLPPNLCCSLLLEESKSGARRRGGVQFALWDRRPIESALHAAGFEVEVVITRGTLGADGSTLRR